jgi:DNA-binding response OmpR family regulator
MAKGVDADIAILDINLDGRRSFPVADVLREKGVKLIFASGYGSPGLEPPFLDEIILKKPFEPSDIRAALARAGSLAPVFLQAEQRGHQAAGEGSCAEARLQQGRWRGRCRR